MQQQQAPSSSQSKNQNSEHGTTENQPRSIRKRRQAVIEGGGMFF